MWVAAVSLLCGLLKSLSARFCGIMNLAESYRLDKLRGLTKIISPYVAQTDWCHLNGIWYMQFRMMVFIIS
nr:hypothetical protein [Tanacetum cinerariifolium]